MPRALLPTEKGLVPGPVGLPGHATLGAGTRRQAQPGWAQQTVGRRPQHTVGHRPGLSFPTVPPTFTTGTTSLLLVPKD